MSISHRKSATGILAYGVVCRHSYDTPASACVDKYIAKLMVGQYCNGNFLWLNSFTCGLRLDNLCKNIHTSVRSHLKLIIKEMNISDPSPAEQTEVTEPNTPPEEWKTCRLRQHARELLREKLTAIAEGEKLLTLEIKRQENEKRYRIAKAPQCEELSLLQESLAKLIPVKLKEEQEVDMDGMDVPVKVVVGNGSDEEQSQSLEREKLTPRKRHKRIERFRGLQRNRRERKARRIETEEEKCLRLERRRTKTAMRLANETEEQRFVRLERVRMARLKRLVTETEEEKSLRIESERRAKERYKLKIESLRFARVQELLLQQMEVANFIGEMIEEDQKADIGDDFEIDKFTPKVLLHEDSSTESESPTKSSTTTDDTTRKIKRETKFDVVSNLLHSICGNSHHSLQQNRLQRFYNFGTSRSSNYILSTVVWHKLNCPTDNGADENLIESDHASTKMEIKAVARY